MINLSNRLERETSPYLLQHKENPVDWYSWCEEAFKRAKEENKPIFLSIGYSSCHWCHVIAHESFEDDEIADIINRHFIAIKVDKEERPDVDSVYMSVCQAFTGSGGWPTSIFMDWEGKPFFAGTYFPKTALKNLLIAIHNEWTDNKDELLKQAEKIIEHLKLKNTSTGNADIKLAHTAVALYERSFDRIFGGFGSAPKFPAPHNILFLLSYYEKFGAKKCLEMAELTLIQMYSGGLFDHIGFGFSRYSTDKRFLVPHFEKMLYDNALLILAYCKAYSVTKKALYLEIAEKTASYILREMTSENGGFFSAQDADSDGEEGKFYTFTREEIIDLLGSEIGEDFNHHYDITESGNFEGKSIPNLLQSNTENKTFEQYLKTIYDYRKKRFSLHLDDKILTSWNSLMISAMCELYMVSKNKDYINAAKKADDFLRNNLYINNTLFVSYREEKRGVKGFLDEYASYIFAQLKLYKATKEEFFLTRAKELSDKVITDFKDTASGFNFYSKESEQLILNPKETYDGAIPSGNSLMAFNLVELFNITKEGKYKLEAKAQLDFISTDAVHHPTGYSMFLLALLEF